MKDFSNEFPQITWVENDSSKYKIFEEGSVFLVALQVRNSRTKTVRWEFGVVEVYCDDDGMSLWYRGKTKLYDSWGWDDFSHFCLLYGVMPYSDIEEQTK